MNGTNRYFLRYTKEHEWVQLADDTGTIGITDHAQKELGDIVFVQLPKVGDTVAVCGARVVQIARGQKRPGDFPAGVPDNVEVVATDAPEGDVEHLPTGAYVVVMTHSHALDFDIVEAALRRDDWRYLGLIGSRAKRHQLERRLGARGVAPAVLARVICPIGRGDLKSKEPGVIAVAVAAEILAIREATAAGACAGTKIARPAATRADPRQAG